MKKARLLFLPLLLLLSSCELLQPPDYVTDMLLPLLKTRIKAETVSKLNQRDFVQTVTMPDVSHFINPVLPVPAFSEQNIGPLPLTDDSDAFIRARLDTAEFQLTVINNFPVNIKAGTTVIITNTSNTDVVFEVVLPEDIPAFGGRRVLGVGLTSTSPWIDNDLRLYLRHFASDGSRGTPVDFGTYNNIQLRFRIRVFRINEVEIPQGKHYELNDTVDFQLYDEDNTANLAEGKLTLFIENGFPATYRFQGYFLDAGFAVVDSLLLQTDVPAPQIDAQGLVQQSTVQERRLVTLWTRDGLLRLRNDARYINLKAQFDVPSPPNLPPGAPIRLRHENQVPLQLVGDLKVEVNP